jgi:hypothetical protein
MGLDLLGVLPVVAEVHSGSEFIVKLLFGFDPFRLGVQRVALLAEHYEPLQHVVKGDLHGIFQVGLDILDIL